MREGSSRHIIREDFKLDFPIKGGWGYSKADAVIIDAGDPAAKMDDAFDGVALEYLFVEKRIYEEFIISRLRHESLTGIQWTLIDRRTEYEHETCVYDVLTFEVTGFLEKDWEALKAEWEGPRGHGSPSFNEAAHEVKRLEAMVRTTQDFWFEISSFYGKGLAIRDKQTGKKKLLKAEEFIWSDPEDASDTVLNDLGNVWADIVRDAKARYFPMLGGDWHLLHQGLLTDPPGRVECFTDSVRYLGNDQWEYASAGTAFDGQSARETYFEKLNTEELLQTVLEDDSNEADPNTYPIDTDIEELPLGPRTAQLLEIAKEVKAVHCVEAIGLWRHGKWPPEAPPPEILSVTGVNRIGLWLHVYKPVYTVNTSRGVGSISPPDPDGTATLFFYEGQSRKTWRVSLSQELLKQIKTHEPAFQKLQSVKD